MTVKAIALVLLWSATADAVAAQDRVASKRAWIEQECGDRVSDAVKEQLASSPVVDAHTHVFNLASVPVKGVLLRFRVPAPVAQGIAEILLRNTGVGDFTRAPALEEAGEASALAELGDRLSAADLRELASYEEPLRKAVARSRRENEGALPDPQDTRLEETGAAILRHGEEAAGPPAQEAGRRSLAMVLELLGGATHPAEAQEVRRLASRSTTEERAPAVAQAVAGFLDMAALLTRREDRIARQLMREYPLVDVFVHHLMDLDHVYDDRARFPPSRQRERAVRLAADDLGLRARMFFSVAFDPFRGEEAFDIVRAGVTAGAVAVKFYPPSGYRPRGTPAPPKPGYLRARFPFLYLPVTARWAQRRQWEARYGAGAPAVDDRIRRFLELVGPPKRGAAGQQGLDVPIFSHHTPVGFEAMPGYGRAMARPADWRPVLDAAPSTRLILAHSGGGDDWFHKGDWEGSFDQQAYELCTTFANTYCDFGMSPEVLTAEGRQAFRRRLESLVPRCAHGTAGCDAPPFDIRDKILYGSDWHMLASEAARTDMICSFAEVLSSPLLEGHAGAFFGGNAFKAMPRLAR